MNTPIRMNRRIITIVAILLIVGISVAKEYPPLLVNWRYPAKTHKIYSLDWDDDGVEEIFAFTSVSRGSKESYLRLNVLEPDGSLELDTDIRGWGTYSATTYTAADERLYGVYVDDINDDGDLDFFVGSWITWGSLNVHKFYRVDRITKEVGGDITHPLKLQWFHEGAGRMNDVEYLDGGILAACLEDAAIYKFTTDGTVEWKSDLEGAVWDIMPVDINRDGLTDILAGTFRSISVVDSSGGLTWDYTTDGRIWGVYAADLDGNIGNEVVGVSEDEEIYVLDSVGNLKSRFSLAGVTAGIAIADFDENGKAEIITASKDRNIYAINSDLWQDWNYSMDNLMGEWEYSTSEAIQSLHVMEGESEKTLLVGTNKALYSFRINPDYVDDEKAKGYYDLALEYYTSRGLDELIEYATLAREIFVRLKDTGGVIKCDKLLLWGENGTLGDRKGLAEEHFSKAQELYGEDVLSNATYYAESAREIYDELGLIRGVMDCDLLLANIDNRWNEIMQDDIKAAEQNIIEAKVSYDGGNYEDAVSYAEKAKEVYLKVSDQDKIDECDSIIKEKKVHGFECDDHCIDIGRPWDLLDANEILLKNMNLKPEKAEVEKFAVVKGPVRIGKGTVIKSGSYIEGPCWIGENCVIGPSCYIRPHSSIGNNAHIGNAVEIKNSIIMDSTNIGHLSYVGDSIIGEGCNFGAGTKVANLRVDNEEVRIEIKNELTASGRRKFGCLMGDGVRTGINVSIMPGRAIYPHASVSAGSIVRNTIYTD